MVFVMWKCTLPQLDECLTDSETLCDSDAKDSDEPTVVEGIPTITLSS